MKRPVDKRLHHRLVVAHRQDEVVTATARHPTANDLEFVRPGDGEVLRTWQTSTDGFTDSDASLARAGFPHGWQGTSKEAAA